MSSKNLYDNEDRIITRMGKGFLSERAVYRGKDLHHDLKDLPWQQLWVLGITGKVFEPNQAKVINFIWNSTSYPDKSIWPNNISALAGTARSTPSLGLSIGMCASEATIYGMNSFVRGLEFFYKASKLIEQGQQLEDIIDNEMTINKFVYGYGRPLASVDERVPHLIQYARDNGMGEGVHLKLALETFKILNAKKGLCMNVAALYCALGADLGFSKEEFQLFMTPVFFAGMPPCYIEAFENPVGTFLPVRCDRIAYEGEIGKKW